SCPQTLRRSCSRARRRAGGRSPCGMHSVQAAAASSHSSSSRRWCSPASPITLLYAALLTLLGAAIVGILPALRVTRVGIQDALRREASARAGLRFGG